MIEAEPETPAMVIERQGKSNSEHKENREHGSIDVVPNHQSNKIGQENHSLCSDYVRQDRADEKPFLAIE